MTGQPQLNDPSLRRISRLFSCICDVFESFDLAGLPFCPPSGGLKTFLLQNVPTSSSNTMSSRSGLPFEPNEYNNNTITHPGETKWFRQLRERKKFLKDPVDYDMFSLMMELYLSKTQGEHCKDKHNGRLNENCMCGMDLLLNRTDTHEGVCKIVTDYHALNTQEKKQYRHNRVKEIIDSEIRRLGEGKRINMGGKPFVLASILNPSDHNRPFCVCRHTFQRLMNIGVRQLQDAWKTYMKTKSEIAPQRKPYERPPSEKDQEISDSVITFMAELIETEGTAHASRVVRGRLGRAYLRDDEKDGVLLPPYLTKKKIYERWVYTRGHIAKEANRLNNYVHARIEDFQKRTDWPDGTHKDVCSRDKFDRIWKTKFKHVKIGLPAKDTCSVCWNFRQEQDRVDHQINLESKKTRGGGATNTQEKDDSSDEESVVFTEDLVAEDVNDGADEEEDDEIAEAQPDSTPVRQTRSQSRSNTNTNNSTVITPYPTDVCTVIQASSGQEELFEKKERLMLESAEHVRKFQMQREYVKEWDRKVKAQGDVQWPNRTHMYCGDYSQNMDLPHFGGEQPGESYYYSPLRVFLFGIADHSNAVLSAYLYHEGFGKKGGDNVVSLIHKKLKDDGILDLAEMHGAGERMIFVFDNCAGQNKNRMVLRYMQYLVDCCVFKEIEIVFLIAGHTKNICDRRFKDAKHNFHKRNVYSIADLVEIMKMGVADAEENEYVSVHEVYPQDFSNWDVFLNKYYSKTVSDVTKQHWFYYSCKASGYVEKRIVVHDNPPKPNKQKLTKLKKKATEEEKREWFDRIKQDYAALKAPPGIPEIKQVELYEKWRPLIPASYQQEMCPDPGVEVRNKVKRATKDRKNRRNAERNGQN